MNKTNGIIIALLAVGVVIGPVVAQDDDFNWTALEDLDDKATNNIVEEPTLGDLDLGDSGDDLTLPDDLTSEHVALDETSAEPIVSGGIEESVSIEEASDAPSDEPIEKLDTPIADTLDLGEEFAWGDDSKLTKNPTGSSDTEETSPVVDSKTSQAYGELLRENLELRKKIGELGEVAESAQKAVSDAVAEKERLVAVVQGLEQTLDNMTVKIDAIKQEKENSTENLDRTIALEEQLAKAETEKVALMDQINAARAKSESKESQVKAGSDLFKQVQKDNTKLKDKLVELETARIQAEKKAEAARLQAEKDSEDAARLKEKAELELRLVKKKEDELAGELKQAREKDKDRKKVIEKMLKQIPDLEKELAKLSADVEAKEVALGSKDKDIELLRSELERRDHRFVKAERMAELLEEAREEVKMVSNIEKRDMHYNMAVVYAKEGRPLDAEREYLRALKLDPTDPAVHYNLGILYEDELNKINKAVLHYKKYIQLAPFAKDVDTVKQWLLDIEMRR